MKEQELKKKIFNAIQEFESLENIESSTEWNNSLIQKLSHKKPNSRFVIASPNYLLIVMLIAALNIGFIFKTINTNSNQTSSRKEELKLVSKELLINPISLNN